MRKKGHLNGYELVFNKKAYQHESARANIRYDEYFEHIQKGYEEHRFDVDILNQSFSIIYRNKGDEASTD
ncbi:MAG: hypothetical protein KDJ28_00265 [Candidatus Competibacteraceae bacterium]|nr:hypothetical protein [Candidatus Competibacteraceae bacterium]